MSFARTAAIATLSVALCTAPAAGQTVGDPALTVDVVASGLEWPTGMAFIGPNDILVTQKNDGRVRRILDGVLQATAVLDVAVDSWGERGLLGIAVDRDFVITRGVFLYYTESATGADTVGETAPLGNRVYRYTWNGATLVSPMLVLDLPADPGPNHDGGVIAFGPDGMLYAVIGDLLRVGKLRNVPTGADPDDTGVILRVDAYGAAAAGNPFFNPSDPSDPMNRYFAYGIRNSFGLAFDARTGDLWDTENGPNSYDEVNRVVSGFNSGWLQLMGPDLRDPEGQDDLWSAPGATYRDPEFSWVLPVAPTSLVFPASPIMGCDLQHDLLVGDNNCGQLYRFGLNAARDGLELVSPDLLDHVADNADERCTEQMDEIRFGDGFGVTTDLENGPDGRIYLVSIAQGAVYRIGPSPGAFPDADADAVADACDCAPTDAGSFAPPGEIPHLRHSAAIPRTLSWDSQAAASGTGTTYTVVAGDVSALRSDGGYASACTLRQGLTQPEFTDARPDPPVGAATYYLVRAENACGTGTFGDGTPVPDPRDALDTALPPACPGAARTGGALVRFDIVRESLTVWVTKGPFIDQARHLLDTGARQVPIFDTLVDGGDCDPQWTWHADPVDVLFSAAAIEVCDGLPSQVEANKPYWLQTVGSFCPWSAVVTAVDDHR